ncbi:hypothetical protein [Methanosarcina sp.]|uniref:hypothetical protein n=1 Tax=Methanosarcina sp. TaxID=2213 RepID=UPI002988080B|nr:hypothetical protein [Methanosarcina sp.]MDW5552290.1 hypothetical protein [Methanosarcina sp.]
MIIAYVDYKVVAKPNKLSKYWPEALRSRIEDGTAKAIHIPFTKDTILRSLEQFNVYNMPETAMIFTARQIIMPLAHLAST